MTFDGNPWKPVPTYPPAPSTAPDLQQAVALVALGTGGLVAGLTGLLGALTEPGMGLVLQTAGRAALVGLAAAAAAAVVGIGVLQLLEPSAKRLRAIGLATCLPAVLITQVGMGVTDDLTIPQIVGAATTVGATLTFGIICLSYPWFVAMRPPSDAVIHTSTPAVGRFAVVVLSLAVIVLAASPATLTKAEQTAISSDADAKTAELGALTEEDLGPRWTQTLSAQFGRGSRGGTHLCGSPDDLPDHVTGWTREFSFLLTREDKEAGNIRHSVIVTPTAADAEREFTGVDAPGYRSCTEAAVARDTAPYAPRATGPPAITFRRQAFPGLEHGIVDRLVAIYPLPDGQKVIHVAFVRMQQGRAIVRLPVMTHNHVISDADLRVIVEAASARLAVAAEQLGDR